MEIFTPQSPYVQSQKVKFTIFLLFTIFFTYYYFTFDYIKCNIIKCMKYEKLCQECKDAKNNLQVSKSSDGECPKCLEKSQDEMLKIIFGETT